MLHRPVETAFFAGIDRSAFERGDARITSFLDPQISGGLLAAVKPGQVVACIADLRAAGYRRAAIIGRVIAARDDGLACCLAKDPEHEGAADPT